jgi:iron complex outermembrane recepter protein
MRILNPRKPAHALLGLLVFGLSLTLLDVPAHADTTITDTTAFSIEPQELAGALKAFAVQSHREIFFAPELARGRKSHGVRGSYDDLKALDLLLEGTGLDFSITPSNAILVRDPTAKGDSLRPPATPASSSSDVVNSDVRVAQASATRTGGAGSADIDNSGSLSSPVSDAEKPRLSEIIVTAQKRQERLQDVPVPVTALSAAALADQNQVSIQDYYNTVPGLSIKTDGHGYDSLSIRGITTGGYTNPTVGIVIDDAPFGPTTGLGSRTSAPDIDPSDLARIEVLRGPQGTLYGANSIGGLLKFVTVDPSTDAFTGRVQGDLDGVHNGTGVGYGVRAAVNVPVTDTIAIRASAFTRRDPGYIDNPELHINGANQVDVEGGRFSALWRPSATFSVKLTAMLQDTTADAPSDVTLGPGLADLQQVQALPGGYHHEVQDYTVTLSGAFAGMNLVSITGYGMDKYDSTIDISAYYGGASSIALYGTPIAAQVGRNKTDKVTQELRLSGTATSRLDWLVGVFYTHEDTPTHDTYYAVNPTTQGAAGFLFDDPYPTNYSEVAGFGDLTVHITDQFNIQFGGRESQNRQRYEETTSGPEWAAFGYPNPTIQPPVHTKDDAFTYLVTPQFKFSQDFMAYARFASGYRPGGPNPTCTVFPTPCEYGPDKTANYELGVKGAAFNGLLSYDASLYYIDWKDIQLQVSDRTTGFSYYTNASRARSQGVELSAQAKPWRGLTVGGWIALNDATLRSDLPPGSTILGSSGDHLPFSTRFSGNLSLDEEFPLSGHVSGFVGGILSYIGERQDNFAFAYIGAPPRYTLPAYAETNVHAGVLIDTWRVNLYVNNLADKRGVLTYPPPFATSLPIVNYIEPRTVGVTVVKKW